MSVVTVLCSHCGQRTEVPSFIGLERPLCARCQRIADEKELKREMEGI